MAQCWPTIPPRWCPTQLALVRSLIRPCQGLGAPRGRALMYRGRGDAHGGGIWGAWIRRTSARSQQDPRRGKRGMIPRSNVRRPSQPQPPTTPSESDGGSPVCLLHVARSSVHGGRTYAYMLKTVWGGARAPPRLVLVPTEGQEARTALPDGTPFLCADRLLLSSETADAFSSGFDAVSTY